MPAALSKMISQNLYALSKIIWIHWLLVFKKVSLYIFQPWPPWSPRLHHASCQGQPCQLLCQRWFLKAYKLSQRWFQFNDSWYLKQFSIIFFSWSALALLKPQAAPDIVPGAAMPAASSKMISQNLQALSKMISIQWLLIFKQFPIIFLSRLQPWLPWNLRPHQASYQGQPCQLLCQRWFHKTYKLCQRWFQFNDSWYLKEFPIIFLSRSQPWPPWNHRQHQASYQGQPCQLLYQKWFHKTYKLCQRWFQFNDFWYLRKFPIISLSRSQPWPPWNPRLHQASYQGQPCQLLYQRWFHKTYKLCQRWFQFNDFWYLKSFPIFLSLDYSLGLPETPGCTRHRTRGSHASCFVKDDFSKPASFVIDYFIQSFLIFKKVSHYLSLLISLGLAEAPDCTKHRTRGSHASCFVTDDFTKPTNFVKDDFNSMTPDIKNKKIPLSFSLDYSLGFPETSGCTRHRTRGSHASCCGHPTLRCTRTHGGCRGRTYGHDGRHHTKGTCLIIYLMQPSMGILTLPCPRVVKHSASTRRRIFTYKKSRLDESLPYLFLAAVNLHRTSLWGMVNLYLIMLIL